MAAAVCAARCRVSQLLMMREAVAEPVVENEKKVGTVEEPAEVGPAVEAIRQAEAEREATVAALHQTLKDIEHRFEQVTSEATGLEQLQACLEVGEDVEQCTQRRDELKVESSSLEAEAARVRTELRRLSSIALYIHGFQPVDSCTQVQLKPFSVCKRNPFKMRFEDLQEAYFLEYPTRWPFDRVWSTIREVLSTCLLLQQHERTIIFAHSMGGLVAACVYESHCPQCFFGFDNPWEGLSAAALMFLEAGPAAAAQRAGAAAGTIAQAAAHPTAQLVAGSTVAVLAAAAAVAAAPAAVEVVEAPAELATEPDDDEATSKTEEADAVASSWSSVIWGAVAVVMAGVAMYGAYRLGDEDAVDRSRHIGESVQQTTTESISKAIASVLGLPKEFLHPVLPDGTTRLAHIHSILAQWRSHSTAKVGLIQVRVNHAAPATIMLFNPPHDDRTTHLCVIDARSLLGHISAHSAITGHASSKEAVTKLLGLE